MVPTKRMKTPVKTSCAMATQQNSCLAPLLIQKSHLHIQLGCVQNEINEINSGLTSGLHFVHLAQLQGQENHIKISLSAIESHIQAILNNRSIFISLLCQCLFYITYYITFYIMFLIYLLVVSDKAACKCDTREQGSRVAQDGFLCKY